MLSSLDILLTSKDARVLFIDVGLKNDVFDKLEVEAFKEGEGRLKLPTKGEGSCDLLLLKEKGECKCKELLLGFSSLLNKLFI